MSASLSTLQFLGYEATELSFRKRIPDDVLKDGEKVEYTPVFERSIENVEKRHHVLRLSVAIGLNQKKLPFSIHVALEGHFQTENATASEDLMKMNATAILFPYLRAAVSQLVMLANISQLILPTYNLVEMFKDQEASLQEPHKEKTVKAIRKSTKKQA